MGLQIPFQNTYARLPDRFYARLDPTPVTQPALIRLNAPLAEGLGLDPETLTAEEGVSTLAGNLVPEGAEPLAQAYAGHQFGGFVPQLGDGRAILLGELVGREGRVDVQLKGAGRTPFSRMGDGRSSLGPVLREYIVSEAMHALGLKTTRALAAVRTGEQVIRETPMPGAVLTRIARSHVRVGTFQYFAVRGDEDGVRALLDHVIARHYPEADGPLGLLRAVIAAQAELIAGWMSVGFIHGVMNTDNMSIAGETIDYGPCAFIDGYHPDTVFSSIDQFGRYAYSAQPQIAVWNLAQLATCLLPLMGEREAATEAVTEALHAFPGLYQAAWLRRFRAKLGLREAEEGDAELVHDLLDLMARDKADFTLTFRNLPDSAPEDEAWQEWHRRWRERLGREGARAQERAPEMARANPALIPRNHRIEEVIAAALTGDYAPFHALADATVQPFDPPDWAAELCDPPRPGQEVRQTFCGT